VKPNWLESNHDPTWEKGVVVHTLDYYLRALLKEGDIPFPQGSCNKDPSDGHVDSQVFPQLWNGGSLTPSLLAYYCLEKKKKKKKKKEEMVILIGVPGSWRNDHWSFCLPSSFCPFTLNIEICLHKLTVKSSFKLFINN